MISIIRLSGVSVSYGNHALLDKVDLQLQSGERVALIGRNGEGKSTLMRVIAGLVDAEEGEVWRDPELRISLLEQDPGGDQQLSVYEAVAEGLGKIGALIAEYHNLSQQSDLDASSLKQLGRLQEQLETDDGWRLEQRVEQVLTQLGLAADRRISELSGGWLRRVALARALVQQPGLLLLDEPTNHLDVETIVWLEQRLLEFTGTLLFITHDRSFLQRLATRIVDLDRGRLRSWACGYADFLRRKQAALDEEERRNAEFDKKLAQEEAWIRQGIKARRTRNEGRVRALQKLRKQRQERRNRLAVARIETQQVEGSGKRVIEVERLRFGYSSEPVVNEFSFNFMRGDRVALIGPNGVGKTTLLKLLLKQLEPESGRVNHGTRMEIAFYTQMREDLDLSMSVLDWVGDGSDFLQINGRKRHVISYLGDFLFSPEKARSPIRTLSGGERNRMLLAKLLRKPANLLVMDEPTNDLDIETLEMLEELLIDFPGSLLLVSHDREFIDNIVTSVLVFQGDGVITESVGGYSDWLRQSTPQPLPEPAPAVKRSPKRNKTANAVTKLSYKERRELDELPMKIEQLEQRQAELNDQVAASDFYRNEKAVITETLNELDGLSLELESSYARWDELEALQARFESGSG